MIVYTVQDSDQQTPLRHPSVMIFEEAASSDLTPGNMSREGLKVLLDDLPVSQNWTNSNNHHHHHRDVKRSAEASDRCDRSPEQSVLHWLQGLSPLHPCRGRSGGSRWSMVGHRHVSTPVKAAHHPSSWCRFVSSCLPVHHFEDRRHDQKDAVFTYERCTRRRTGLSLGKPTILPKIVGVMWSRPRSLSGKINCAPAQHSRYKAVHQIWSL